MTDTETYWAAEEDAALFGQKLKDVVEANADSEMARRIRDEQANSYLQSFAISIGGQASSSRLMRDGQEGELAVFRVPTANALANAVVALVTNNRVTWDCKASNADAESRGQCTIGNNALDLYWHDREVEKHAVGVCDEACRFGECFTFVEFDPTAGEIHALEQIQGEMPPVVGEMPPNPSESVEAPQFEGDVRFNTVSSWDVIRDSSAKSFEDCDWVAARVRRNRFDLAARYGAAVLEACSDGRQGMLRPVAKTDNKTRTELVDVWHWFHRKTASMPHGRQAVIIGDTAFELQPLKYREVPIARLASGRLIGTPFPFAPFWTALGAQEVQDSLYSALVTNNLNLGTQMVSAPMGSEIEPSSFGPMQLLMHPPGTEPPKALNLVQSAPETFKLLEKVQSDQKQVLGLNNTSLGQPEGANLSGVAMSLLASMAIQANSSFQAAYADYVKRIGNIFMHVVQDFFSVERKIEIAGKSASYLVTQKPFSGESVKHISSVSVRIGNPIAQTVAGREQIFDKHLQVQVQTGLPMFKTPEDVEQLLETGRIESLTDDLRDQALLVEAENEALSRNEPVVALLGDDDVYHCKHHRSVVTSLDARQDEQLLNNALDHVHQHYANYFGPVVDPMTGMPAVDPMTGEPAPPTVDPLYRQNMMLLFGIQIPAPPAPVGPGPGMADSEALGAQNTPAPGEAPGKLPVNPLTGAEFNLQTGGGIVPPAGA